MNNNHLDKIINSALTAQVAPPQQQSIPIIAFAEGLAALVCAGVFTQKQVFDWITYGKQPTDFVPPV